MDNIANKIIKDYEKNSNKISNELNNEGVNYFNQERQMTFLIEDDDETYKNQSKDIVKGLREEAENKKKEIINKYDAKTKEINDKYYLNSNNIFGCHEIDMLKENLKLDITKEINSSVL